MQPNVYVAAGLCVLYVAALALLLWAAKRKRNLYALAKGLCSGLFLLCAVLAFMQGAKMNLFAFIVLMAALLACAFGDVLLGVANRSKGLVHKRPFVFGAGAFTLAHLLFCVLLYQYDAPRWYDVIAPLLFLAVLYLLERTDRIRLKKMRPLGYIYTFLVSLMAGKALGNACLQGRPAPGAWMVAAGAVLFFLSDVLLLFLYFGTRRKQWHRGTNLVLYYAGMLLLAFGAYWM